MIRALTLLALVGSLGCGIGAAQQQLRTAIDARQGEMDQCYQSALDNDSGVSGQLYGTVNVDRETGRVASVEFDRGDAGGGLNSCLNGVLTQVELSEAPSANLSVNYTFNLVARTAPAPAE